jgi:hypothetical protein
MQTKQRHKKTERRIYCRNRSCGCSLTPADLEARFCTQCFVPLVAETFPLEAALMLSLSEMQSKRSERKAAAA